MIEIKRIAEGAVDSRGLKIFGPVVRLSMTTEDGHVSDMQFSVLQFEQILDDWKSVANGHGREFDVIQQFSIEDFGRSLLGAAPHV